MPHGGRSGSRWPNRRSRRRCGSPTAIRFSWPNSPGSWPTSVRRKRPKAPRKRPSMRTLVLDRLGRAWDWRNFACIAGRSRSQPPPCAWRLNPNDIYAQSAMVALLQEQGQRRRSPDAGRLLAEHAGAEEIGRFAFARKPNTASSPRCFLERNIDLMPLAADNRHLLWIAIIAPGVLLWRNPLLSHPHRPLPGILFAVVPPLLIWLYLRIWD